MGNLFLQDSNLGFVKVLHLLVAEPVTPLEPLVVGFYRFMVPVQARRRFSCSLSFSQRSLLWVIPTSTLSTSERLTSLSGTTNSFLAMFSHWLIVPGLLILVGIGFRFRLPEAAAMAGQQITASGLVPSERAAIRALVARCIVYLKVAKVPAHHHSTSIIVFSPLRVAHFAW